MVEQQTSARTSLAPTLFHCLLLTSVLAAGASLRAETIDRILAVVDRSIILQSDVLAAMRLGPPAPVRPLSAAPSRVEANLGGPTAVAAVLDTLIERRLMLNEVDRYAPADPPGAEVDKVLASIRGRFTSDAEFKTVLDQVGLTLEVLGRNVLDDLRLESYLQERFGVPLTPSEDDILRYYQTHQAQFSRGAVPRAFGEAHDDVRDALIAERRREQIQAWIAGLRRRADITVLLQSPTG